MSTTKKEPQIDWSEFDQFVTEFKGETDRAAVILGAAKLDLLLLQILQRVLLPCPRSSDELFDGDAPLSTFSARIALLHRLGVIDDAFARELHLIRRTRNAFAHEVLGCRLDSGGHRERVKEVYLPFRDLKFTGFFQSHYFDKEKGPSADFRTALAILVARLEHLLLYVRSLAFTSPMPLVRSDWEKLGTTDEGAEAMPEVAESEEPSRAGDG
ncbi:MAG: hypothetical protein ABIK85_11190 [Candidatus Eisenbacteria bacterium]